MNAKHKRIDDMLATGRGLFVQLDPRGDEVLVPEHLSKQPLLGLAIGLNMSITIPDLALTEEGIVCTLTFDRRPFKCFLPWKSLLSVSFDGDAGGWSWIRFPEETPFVFAREGQKAKAPVPAAKPAEKPKARGHLRLVVNNG